MKNPAAPGSRALRSDRACEEQSDELLRSIVGGSRDSRCERAQCAHGTSCHGRAPTQPAAAENLGDLNACGWSGEADDDCYYALAPDALAALPAQAGLEVFVYDTSDEAEILGFVARLERFRDGWRARPISGLYVEQPQW